MNKQKRSTQRFEQAEMVQEAMKQDCLRTGSVRRQLVRLQGSLGGTTSIAMMQAAEMRNRDHVAQFGPSRDPGTKYDTLRLEMFIRNTSEAVALDNDCARKYNGARRLGLAA